MEQTSDREPTSYRSALGHYLSPRRRDPVKTIMEEVVSHEIFARALSCLHLDLGDPVRVLDLGSGTGDGLELLTKRHGGLPPVTVRHPLHYVGVDASPEMVETARSLHGNGTVIFHVGDMRAELPPGEFDLYLSCGVPYSHLSFSAVVAVICNIFHRINTTRSRAAVIIDVLGRYSIEWTPKWHMTRWPYDMTFFEDATGRIEEQMTFFDRTGLNAAIAEAVKRTGVHPCDILFTDRSLVVGRHTATRAFNPAIPPYRTLINELACGNNDIAPAELYFRSPTGSAPPEVQSFFSAFGKSWNSVIDHALRAGDGGWSSSQAVSLASGLLQCERQQQRGLGVGHSLTATVIVDAASIKRRAALAHPG